MIFNDGEDTAQTPADVRAILTARLAGLEESRKGIDPDHMPTAAAATDGAIAETKAKLAALGAP